MYNLRFSTARGWRRVVQTVVGLEPRPAGYVALGSEGELEMPLTNKDVKHFKQLLLAKRSALQVDANHLEEEAVRKSKDDAATLDISNFADLGTDNYEQEFDLSVLEHQGQTLREIDAALERIEQGSFGTCDSCGKPIPKGRLTAMPHARFCIACLNEQEQSGY